MNDRCACEIIFAERLKALRLSRNLSQIELAKELEVSSSTISYYENAGRSPQLFFLQKVSRYFGVSYEYLMGDSDVTNNDNLNTVKTTGLSEDSIMLLINEYKKNGRTAILDLLIKNENFGEALDLIELEALDDPAHFNNDQPLQRNHSVFILNTLFMKCIAEVLRDRSSEITYSILKQNLSGNEMIAFKKWIENELKNKPFKSSQLRRLRSTETLKIIRKFKCSESLNNIIEKIGNEKRIAQQVDQLMTYTTQNKEE